MSGPVADCYDVRVVRRGEGSRWVLRDLPGVAELERRLEDISKHRYPTWAPGVDNLQDDVARLTRKLFDLDQFDTYSPADEITEETTDEEYDRLYARWEENFKLLDSDDGDAMLIVFDAMGWDVRDENGNVLMALDYIGRQVVCVAKGLKGSPPDPGGVTREALEDWETTLAAEAEQFRRRRRGGGR